jgi:hypothetical protein
VPPRALLVVVAVTLAFAIATSVRAAWAGELDAAPPDPIAEADALYAAAETDDAELRFARAADRYEASIAKAPSHRHAPRARARAEVLRRHAEADFVPYTRLERVRRDPELSSDPAALAALAEDARAFPPGLVRVEARMLAAEAYLGRLQRPADAVPLLREVVADPATDPLSGRLARRELVDTLQRLGDLDGAARAAKADGADPQLARTVAVQARRMYLHTTAIAALGLFFLAAAIGIGKRIGQSATEVKTALRGFATVTIAFALWSGVLGGLLASTYETGNAKPFLLFGAGLVPLLLLARAWGAVARGGDNRGWSRVGRAGISAASVVAAGFLVLESVDVSYLEGFGL